MIELPEAIVLANQLDELIEGKVIKNAIRGHTPHTFIFPQDRDQLKEKGWDTDNPYQIGQENTFDSKTHDRDEDNRSRTMHQDTRD